MHLQYRNTPFFPLESCFMRYFSSGMHVNQNFEAFRFSSFFFFFLRLFLLLSKNYLFAAVFKLSPRIHEKATLRREIVECSGGKFGLRLYLKFLSIFVHISRLIDPVTLIWVSLERSIPPAELEYKWYQFVVKSNDDRSGLKAKVSVVKNAGRL